MWSITSFPPTCVNNHFMEITWRSIPGVLAVGYTTTCDANIPWVPATLLWILFPTNLPGKATANDPSALDPCHPSGRTKWNSSSWIPHSPVPATAAIWGVGQQIDDLSLSITVFQISKWILRKRGEGKGGRGREKRGKQRKERRKEEEESVIISGRDKKASHFIFIISLNSFLPTSPLTIHFSNY